ncbi:MAG: thiolase family protein [Acidimicrobiia bacterium]|nr:thiolase family protein [Acidimicrobiia bacterium]
MPHPFRDVAVVGIHNTQQAKVLEGHDSQSIALEAALGAIDDAGLTPRDIDGVVGGLASNFLYQSRIGPAWRSMSPLGIPAVLEGAMAIACGLATTVLVATGEAGSYREHSRTAPWTRPTHEFVASYGMFTAAEFAFMARRHMHMYGTTPEQMAHVAAVIRNNGSAHPGAVYSGRGPFSAADILDSRMIADPFRLLDCAMTSEGATALVLTRADRADDLARPPVYLLGGGTDHLGPSYQHPPAWDLGGVRRPDLIAGHVGRRAAEEAFATAGLGPSDVDVCEFYDPFSFEIIRQFEAFGFCAEGEGGAYVTSGAIEPGGATPVTTDGGTMSFSHGGAAVQLIQRVVRGVEQLRGTCASMQVPGAEVAMCTGGGSGALFTDVLLLGTGRP